MSSLQPVTAVDSSVYYESSHQQRWDMFRNRMKRPGDPLFKITWVERVPEQNPIVIEKVFAKLIQRHASLRTVMTDISGKLYFTILDYDPELFKVRFFDYDLWHGSQENVNKHISDEKNRLIDFDSEPFVRIHAYKVEDGAHIIALFAEHIVVDARSLDVLRNEFIMLREELLTNGGMLNFPAPDWQITDLIKWRNRVACDVKNIRYWEERTKDRCYDIDIRTAYAKTRLSYTPRNDHVEAGFVCYLDQLTTQRLDEIARSARPNLAGMLVGLINIFFSKVYQQPNILTGHVFHGREKTEFNQIVANCSEIIFLFSQVSAQLNVIDCIRQINREFYKAIKFKYPWDPAIGQPFATSNVADLNFFGRDNGLYTRHIEDHSKRIHIARDGCSRAGLSWYLVITEHPNGLEFNCSYSNDCYSPKLVECMFDSFLGMCRAITSNPGIKIEDLKLLL